MNLAQVRAIKEDQTHFHVDHEKRGSWSIPKRLITPEQTDHIRSFMMGKEAAKKAEQNPIGSTIKAAEGVDVPAANDDPVATAPYVAPDLILDDQQVPNDGQVPNSPVAPVYLKDLPPPAAVPNIGRQVNLAPLPTGNSSGATPYLDAVFAPENGVLSAVENWRQGGDLATPETPAPVVPAVAPTEEAPVPAVVAPASAPTPAAPPPVGPAPAPKVAGPAPSFDDSVTGKALAKVQKDFDDATNASAATAKEFADKQAKIRNDWNIKQELMRDSYQDTMEDWQKKQAQTLAWLADPANKIDPQRLFHNQGIGGSIAMVLGSALGAFGAGLTHGPNAYWDVVNKAVDRDVAAQQANRAEKQSLYQNYLAQGRSVQDAYKLAKADGLDNVAGLIAANQDKLAGADAQNQAKLGIAKFTQTATKLRQDAELNDLQIKNLPRQWAADQALKSVQLQEAQFNLTNQKRGMVYQQRLRNITTGRPPDEGINPATLRQLGLAPVSASDGANPGANPLAAVTKAELLADPSKIPEHYIQIPRVKQIKTEDGQTEFTTVRNPKTGDIIRDAGVTYSPKDDKTKEKIESWEQVDNALQQWDAFIRDNPNGASFSPTQQARFKALSKPLVAEATKAAAGRTSAPEIDAFTQAYGDPSSSWNAIFDTAKAARTEIGKTHHSELQTILGNNVLQWGR
jgi:hypothetical protein